MYRPRLPLRTRFEPTEWREMSTQLNADLKEVRSAIGPRERERLDKIENVVRGYGGRLARHPRYLQLVERNGEQLFLGSQEISYCDLIDRSLDDAFTIAYFDHADLEYQIEAFFCSLTFQCAPADRAPRIDPGRKLLSIPQWTVRSLARIYKHVFELEPYIGGVSASIVMREPHSPFGTFAKFVLDRSGLKTRNGSRYSMKTIKNYFGPSNIREARLSDEPELIAARRELEIEQSLVRKRGRPPKAKTVANYTPGSVSSTANGTHETN